jgi:hypothetical protein
LPDGDVERLNDSIHFLPRIESSQTEPNGRGDEGIGDLHSPQDMAWFGLCRRACRAGTDGNDISQFQHQSLSIHGREADIKIARDAFRRVTIENEPVYAVPQMIPEVRTQFSDLPIFLLLDLAAEVAGDSEADDEENW